MTFSDIETTKRTDKMTKRVAFMETKEGIHRIRILDSDYKVYPTHYFAYSKTTVLCLDDECPVCQNNKKLIMQFPNDFRNQPGYNRRSYRYFVNVMDKTPARVCVCGKEYKGLQFSFCTCGEKLPEQQAPLNKVKVLSKGESLFADLGAIESAILDEKGERIGLTNYDINLVVKGSGRDTTYTAVADTNSREPVNIPVEDLYDLSNAVIKLEPNEMLDAQRGISLKDIFSARKAKSVEKADEQPVKVVADEKSLEEVRESLDNLFKQ